MQTVVVSALPGLLIIMPPTLLPRASWRRRCGRNGASTRPLNRWQRPWRRWAGRCFSSASPLPRQRRSTSRPRAVVPVSHCTNSSISNPRIAPRGQQRAPMLAGAGGRGTAYGVVPRRFCSRHCGRWRRPSARYAVLIEPTCWCEAGPGRSRAGAMGRGRDSMEMRRLSKRADGRALAGLAC